LPLALGAFLRAASTESEFPLQEKSFRLSRLRYRPRSGFRLSINCSKRKTKIITA